MAELELAGAWLRGSSQAFQLNERYVAFCSSPDFSLPYANIDFDHWASLSLWSKDDLQRIRAIKNKSVSLLDIEKTVMTMKQPLHANIFSSTKTPGVFECC
jgi:hypothetical protein